MSWVGGGEEGGEQRGDEGGGKRGRGTLVRNMQLGYKMFCDVSRYSLVLTPRGYLNDQ